MLLVMLLCSLACVSKTFEKCDWPKNKHFFISLKIEFEISLKVKDPPLYLSLALHCWAKF